VLGATLLALVLTTGLLSPLLGHPVGADVDPTRAGLGLGHGLGLGFDHLGRDVLARLALGARAFVLPGLLAVLVGTLVGVPSGLLRSAASGRLGELISLPLRALAAVPALVLVVLVLSVLGNSWAHLGLATGLALAPSLHEAVHQRLAPLQSDAYVQAMRAHGVPELELWLGHLLLGAAGPAVVRAALRGLATVLVLECTLSYLGGFGVQEPWPSWGNMLVFEWGRGWGAGVWAPVVALLATLWACLASAALVEDPDHG
jgi:ABC-type dipeptide/oligopeptide/nickel transport system permease subunit